MSTKKRLESVWIGRDGGLLDEMLTFYAPGAKRIVDVCCNQLFVVGEIAIGQGHVRHTELNGMECEVLTPLFFNERSWVQRENARVPKPAWVHRVKWANGWLSCAAPWNLRKKRPPTEDMDERESEEIEA